MKAQKSKETCLVLGANGFVGSYLVEEIAQIQGMHVKAFDRFSREPIFEPTSNVTIVKGDIFNEYDLREAFEGVTYVMHSFSATTPFISDQNPYKDIEENLMISVKIFELCAELGIRKVGFISSAGTVYGSVTEKKTATETDAPSPVSPYGINKLGIEHYLEYFKRKYGTQYTIYRLTNPYGPRQVVKHNQGVIPAFIEKIKAKDELVLYGDGTSSRDYVYMKDAASMIVESFSQDSEYSVYNIGSGAQTDLNEIIEALAVATKKAPKVVYKEAPKTFLTHSSVSVDRFFSEFGQRTLTTLHDGIAQTIRSLK